MKLLFFCPDWFPISAGLSQSCLEICKGLEKQGHEVKIVVAKEPNTDSKGMKLVKVPYLFRLLGRNPLPLFYWKHIKKEIAWADKICLFSYMYEMNSRIVLYKKLGLFNKEIIHFYRGSLERDGVQFLSTITKVAKEVWDASFGRIMFTWTDATISNSKPTIQYIIKKYGVQKEKLFYVPTGINATTYKQSTLQNKRVLFVGRLVENKGVHHFEDIVKAIPQDWKFTIVDTGPMQPYVDELSNKYPQIELKGKIPHEELKKLFSKSDLLILPSYAEGSPRAVIEATASGVSCISFNVGDVSSFIPKESTIPIGNIKRFIQVMKQLIRDPKELKKRVTHASKDITQTNKMIANILEQVHS